MENAAPSRSDQRSTVTLGELLESTWKSLWSTPVVMWMRQPMRRTSVSGWMESMRESTRSLAGRSISVGPIVVGVRKPLGRAAEPMKPIRPPVAPTPTPLTRPVFPPARPPRPESALKVSAATSPRTKWVRNPLPSVSANELMDLARRHECPRCHGGKFRRSRPRSVEWLLSLVRVFPYRCYSCNWRFFGLSLERDSVGRERETQTSLWYSQ